MPPERVANDGKARELGRPASRVRVVDGEPAGDALGELADSPEALPFDSARADRGDLIAKRAFDLVVGSVLVILSLPLWLAAAIAVRLDSRGPILFRQERVGSRPVRADGGLRWRMVTFTVYKFRTMKADADEEVHRAIIRSIAAGATSVGDEPHDADAPFKMTQDPRVTRVGRWLRRTSLDELPQLINVLEGTMSLVGPRPLPTYEVAEFRDWQYERLCARPGITGRWQVDGRGRTSIDEGTRMDIDYVRERSLARDGVLLLRTLPAVLSRRGAA